MSVPILTWEGKKEIETEFNALSEWELGTVNANADSDIWEFKIWNGKGISGLSKCENCSLITKTFPDEYDFMPSSNGVVYNESNDPVGYRWTKVHRPNIDITVPFPIFNPIGNGTRVSIKAVNESVPSYQIYGDDTENQSSDKKYALIKAKVTSPSNSLSGIYALLFRMEYTFV